ncbi:hypothetical protein Y032_0778g2285 [Ancylostoma ceylanicum]|uniref:Uncharacterized protein n=1 Tax=Ancylostoma ceylanicum TaxID=53326 RepID=A0A016WCP7_9BILA|nr:hypothetical protein Y032_0778g2285 [Ancylostoma ceylanicum]
MWDVPRIRLHLNIVEALNASLLAPKNMSRRCQILLLIASLLCIIVVSGEYRDPHYYYYGRCADECSDCRELCFIPPDGDCNSIMCTHYRF